MYLAITLSLSLTAPEQPAADLDAAVASATEVEREVAIANLEHALENLSQQPSQATPDGPSADVLEARVILVRLYLAEGDEAAAEAAMDELIRLARGRVPPVREFGGQVTKLYETRNKGIEAAGTATLEVQCEVACSVVVSGRLVEGHSEQLPLGTYRVWVKALDRDVDWESREIQLVEPNTRVTEIVADPAPPAVVEPVAPAAAPVDEGRPNKKRRLPRGAEIAGVVVGVGLMVAGGVMLSLDDQCSLSGDRATPDTTPEECGDVFQTLTSGATMLGVGGGVLLVSGILLTVDEVRVGRSKGRQVTLGFALKF